VGDPIPLANGLLEECTELLASIDADIAGVGSPSPSRDILTRMQRNAHTAKGLMGFLGVPEMDGLASQLTETLRRLRDSEIEFTQDLANEIGAHTTKLTELLSAVRASSGPTGAQPVPQPDQQDAHATMVFSETGDAIPATHSPSWDEFHASACRGKVEALSKAVAEVLVTFDIGSVACAEDHPGGPLATAHDLTVLVDANEPLEATVIFGFDRDVAGALARKMATAMTGDKVEVRSDEEAEFMRGTLGEVLNFTMLGTFNELGLPPKVMAPRFVDGRGVRLFPNPRPSRFFSVETELGGFDVGYVPGAPLSEGPNSLFEEGGAVSRGKVVIADDSLIMRKMLEGVLVGGGYDVVAHARGGGEAVEQFRRHRPDLVTMDINMPVMSGLDALRIIRAEDPSARVLLCSAIAESGVVRRGLNSGAVGYITKPFKPESFLEAVEYLMKQGAAASALDKRDDSSRPEIDSLGIYRVEKILGEGGMALVYKGYDPGLGRGVALKVIRDRYSGNVDLVVRFLEEARAVARVSHANIVSIYFAGSDRGRHFFAMELLPGPDLEELVYRDGPLTPRKALSYIRQGATGLAAAAEKGLIHCDVKPSNLVFGADGMVKVTDFGIAQKAGTEEDPTISEMVGTPCFMSPEQVLEKSIDHRADIYSLGATRYYLLTGEPPYDGDDEVEVALRHVHDPVPSLPGKFRKLNELLGRMMAKDPKARHAGHDELVKDIAGLF